jgi:DNA-directed RNA polymerase subunit M/transcription elongation factor TFIIS
MQNGRCAWKAAELEAALHLAIQSSIISDGDHFLFHIVDALYSLQAKARSPSEGKGQASSLAQGSLSHGLEPSPVVLTAEEKALRQFLERTPAQILHLERVQPLARCKACGTGISPIAVTTRAADENPTEVYKCPNPSCGKITKMRD